MKTQSKQEAIDYVNHLLIDKGIRKIRIGNQSIRSCCPYHGGNNGTSFRVHFKKSEPFFNCWACGENGSIAQLVAFLNGTSLSKAVKHLEKNTIIGDFSLKTLLHKVSKTKQLLEESVDRAVEHPPSAINQQPMYTYLNKRARLAHGLIMVEYIINRYHLYYCNAGRYSGRIIMPIILDGKTIAYNDRTITDSKLKSLHQSGAIFDKIVHGLDEAMGKKIGVVVEGAFDMFQLVSFFKHSKGYEDYGSVNLMGSNISQEKVAQIASVFEEVILMLDHDKAGLKGLKNAYLFEQFMPCRIVTKALPYGKDPGMCSSQEFKRYFKFKPKEMSFLERLQTEAKVVGRKSYAIDED